MKLVIIGSGAWGSALYSTWKSRFSESYGLDAHSTAEAWKSAFSKPCLAVLACPFHTIASIIEKLSHYPELRGVINASKGIDQKSLKTFSSLAKAVLQVPFASLSGPTFAKELIKKKPTAAVLAGWNHPFLEEMLPLLSTKYFRLYASSDPIGIEVCGAVKNVLAMAAGISDGLKLGDNARAALLTRGLVEIQMINHVLGGQVPTVFGLAGIGDLWLTSTGSLSRNRNVGILLAQKYSLPQIQKKIGATCEGLYTVKQIDALIKKAKISLPICHEIYKICYKKQDPMKSLNSLMSRALKIEEPIDWQALKTSFPNDQFLL